MKRAVKKRQARRDPDGHVFKGAEVFEFFRHFVNPTGYKSDWLLMRAKRVVPMVVKRVPDVAKLSDGELRAVAWFAFLPRCADSAADRVRLRRALQDHGNQLANTFFEVWLREPISVGALISELQSKMSHGQTEQVTEDMLEWADGKPPDNLEGPPKGVRKRVAIARSQAHPSDTIIKAAAALRKTVDRKA